MPESLVLSLVGPDRPGIVESLSRVIESHGDVIPLVGFEGHGRRRYHLDE